MACCKGYRLANAVVATKVTPMPLIPCSTEATANMKVNNKFSKLKMYFEQTIINIPHEIVFGNALRKRDEEI